MNEHDLPDNFFTRDDESPDHLFYASPRLTTHIDDATINALTDYYREVLKPEDHLLDLMSSWISHLPTEVNYAHVTGHGMNAEELAANTRLSEFIVQDLNNNPTFPWPNDSFNAVMIVVSIQYLTDPFAVFNEIARVLAPSGRCIVAMSHRLFPTKAIEAFKVLAPAQRSQIVGTYLQHTGVMSDIEMIDRSPPRGADPLWIVTGTKRADLRPG